jgi:hypothetical protein
MISTVRGLRSNRAFAAAGFQFQIESIQRGTTRVSNSGIQVFASENPARDNVLKMMNRFSGLGCAGIALAILSGLAVAPSAAAQASDSNPAPTQDAAQNSTQAPPAASATPAAAPQQNTTTPANPPAAAQTQNLPDKPVPADQKNTSKPGSNDRLFYALPNFSTVESSQHLPPLSTGQKFKLVARGSFDPYQFAFIGVVSGISQAENSEPGYGQGWGAYGIRYASALGDSLTESFMVGAILPSVLHQDPRYYQSGHGSFLRRTGYALSRLVITRGDSGNAQFNASEVVGSALAAGIVTYSYHPHEDKTLSNTASVWGTQVAYDALSYELKEFWPDLRRKFSQKKHQHDDPQP